MPGNNNWINLKVASDDVYCSLDFVNFNPMPKQEAIAYNVERIASKYDNLFVALSGGIHSEFAAKSLLQHGVKFRPLIIDFELNSAEVWYAYRWCYENNITPSIVKLPLSTMITQLPGIARHFNTQYISALEFVIEKYVSHISGQVIVGGADPFSNTGVLSDRLDQPLSQNLSINSYDFGLELSVGDKHPASFITYTPELFYSLIRDIDYTKPIQLAMAEYYGVIPRPNFDQAFNFQLNQEVSKISREVNSNSRLYNFYIGSKDDLLNRALLKEEFICKITLKSGRTV